MAFIYLSDLTGVDPREGDWTKDLVSAMRGQSGMGDLAGAKSKRLWNFAQMQNAAIQKALDAGDQTAAIKAAAVTPWFTSISDQKVQEILANPDANKAAFQRIANQAAATGFASLPQVVPAAAGIPPQPGVPLPGGKVVPPGGIQPADGPSAGPAVTGASGTSLPPGGRVPSRIDAAPGGVSIVGLIGLGVAGVGLVVGLVLWKRKKRAEKAAAKAAASATKAP
jgi:hypothetical protein